MTTNVIKQIVRDGEYGSQTIKMVVKSNERGPKGEKGESGMAATISAGNAYSVPAGSSPSVINVGTENEATFDFYIPKGEKGEKGDSGEPGKDGYMQYIAGTGITITGKIISAQVPAWGNITGDLSDQVDLIDAFQNLETTVIALNNYSTSEIDTGAKWIDGKVIYKRTVSTGALPNNATKSVAHGIGTTWDRIIKTEGYAYDPTFNMGIFFPSGDVLIAVANNNIELTTASNLGDFNESYTTLYYTKKA